MVHCGRAFLFSLSSLSVSLIINYNDLIQIADLNTVFSADAPHISTCNISKPETMQQFSSLLANSD